MLLMLHLISSLEGVPAPDGKLFLPDGTETSVLDTLAAVRKDAGGESKASVSVYA